MCSDRVHHRALREQDCALFGAVRSVHTLKGCLERSGFLLTEFRNIARRRKGCSGIHPPSSPSVRNLTSMPISDRYYPCVFFESRSSLRSLMCAPPAQVSKDPSQKPDVDLVVVRENTECLVRPRVSRPSATLLHVDATRLRCG